MNRFENKNILVTGASSGIGKAVAKRIAEEGGNLALIDINVEQLEAVAKELSQFGTKIIYSKCNVSQHNESQSVINDLCAELEGLHGLSHNAGILRCHLTHLITPEEWNEVIAINLTGTFNINKHALPHLLKNKVSYLVNNASNAAEQPHPWMAAYAATKGAIKSFTRSLFIEYFLQGLRANCVMPGSIKSSLGEGFTIPEGGDPSLIKTLIPLGKSRLVNPAHVASVIALLLSEDGFHVNGTEIVVDGGGIY